MNDVVAVLIIILIIVLVLRGPKTLPELGRMFGRGIREARIEASKLRSDDDDKPTDGGTAQS